MEGAGKLVEDDELREAMSEKGLGTPATRAAIIEGLIYESYVQRNGRELQATAKAFSLMELLNGLGIPELTKPELTGDWEFNCSRCSAGRISRDRIHVGNCRHDAAHRRARQEVRERHHPRRFRHAEDALPEMRRRNPREIQAVPMPEVRFCDVENVVQPDVRDRGSRGTHHQEADRAVAGFPQQAWAFPFAAVLKLTPEFKTEFDFGNDQSKDGEAAATVDFTGKEPLGKCPKCGARRV